MSHHVTLTANDGRKYDLTVEEVPLNDDTPDSPTYHVVSIEPEDWYDPDNPTDVLGHVIILARIDPVGVLGPDRLAGDIGGRLAATPPHMRLAVLDQLPSRVKAETDETVAELRDQGVSWAAIGEILGVSRQAAHERFRHTERTVRTVALCGHCGQRIIRPKGEWAHQPDNGAPTNIFCDKDDQGGSRAEP